MDLNYFTCTTDSNYAKCEKNNPIANVLYASAEALDSSGNLNQGYVVGETIIGDAYLTNDMLDIIFPSFLNKCQTDYSIDKCYADDITSEIAPYVSNLISDGFKLYSDGFYKKTVGDNVYAFGYKQKTISWNVTKKEYANSQYSTLRFGCEYFNL